MLPSNIESLRKVLVPLQLQIKFALKHVEIEKNKSAHEFLEIMRRNHCEIDQIMSAR